MKGALARTLPWLLCMSCRGPATSPVDLPRRAAPPGYPAPRGQELPASLALVTQEQLARALGGRSYRVRWGTFPARCEDCPVDALSSSYPIPAEGPFESEVPIAPGDVSVRLVTAAPVAPGDRSPRRLIACVDIRPSLVPHVANRDTIVLDVQPLGDDPPMPLVIDAVTAEPLAIDPARLVDETNTVCDTRLMARAHWDDNLRRLHQSRQR